MFWYIFESRTFICEDFSCKNDRQFCYRQKTLDLRSMTLYWSTVYNYNRSFLEQLLLAKVFLRRYIYPRLIYAFILMFLNLVKTITEQFGILTVPFYITFTHSVYQFHNILKIYFTQYLVLTYKGVLNICTYKHYSQPNMTIQDGVLESMPLEYSLLLTYIKEYLYFHPQLGETRPTSFGPASYQDFKEIRSRCLAEGRLFEDPEFPPIDRSLYYKERLDRPITWLRPGVSSQYTEFIRYTSGIIQTRG